MHTHIRIDRLHATLGRFCLRHPTARISVYIERLPLQIRHLHHIAVDQGQRAHASARKQVNRYASKCAATNNQRARIGKASLRRDAKPRQDHLPMVA
jgi:hypothetical protein